MHVSELQAEFIAALEGRGDLAKLLEDAKAVGGGFCLMGMLPPGVVDYSTMKIARPLTAEEVATFTEPLTDTRVFWTRTTRAWSLWNAFVTHCGLGLKD